MTPQEACPEQLKYNRNMSKGYLQLSIKDSGPHCLNFFKFYSKDTEN